MSNLARRNDLTTETVLAEFVPPSSHTPAVYQQIEKALQQGDTQTLIAIIQAANQMADQARLIQMQQLQGAAWLSHNAPPGSHINVRFGNVTVNNKLNLDLSRTENHDHSSPAGVLMMAIATAMILFILLPAFINAGTSLNQPQSTQTEGVR